MDDETATFFGFPNPTVPVPGPPEIPVPGAVSDCPTGVLWGATGSKERSLLPLVASNARNDPAQALPQRLLDPVGVWNSVDGDNCLGHGHPADLGVVIGEGEDRGHYLPGLVRSHKPAQQRGKGGVHFGESSLSLDPNTLEAGQYEGPEYLS